MLTNDVVSFEQRGPVVKYLLVVLLGAVASASAANVANTEVLLPSDESSSEKYGTKYQSVRLT